MPALTLTLSMVIFGTVGLFAVEAGLQPFATVFWRCVFAALFMAGWCWLKGFLHVQSLSRRLAIRATICGICNIGSGVALFAAYKSTTIATATIVYHIQPFFVVLIGIVFLKENVRLYELLWMAIAFIGMILATGLVGGTGETNASSMIGIALALLAALLYAVGTILGKELGDQRPEVTTLIQVIAGAAMLAPFANIEQSVPIPSWKWLIGLGVLHTGIAYTLMYSAYPRLTTPVIGVLAFVFPLVSILVDWIAYSNPIEPIQAAGMSLIMLGTLGVQLGWSLPKKSGSCRAS